MFSHGGSELAEKITRDSSTLGNLITRHLAEFDRTVKTYGGELVERLGQRTTEVSERDARLHRRLRRQGQHQGDRGHRDARPAPGALPGGARQPHPDAQRRPLLARHGHRQDAGRRRQGGRHRARQAHRRRHRHHQHPRRQARRDDRRQDRRDRQGARHPRHRSRQHPRHPHRPLRAAAGRPRRARHRADRGAHQGRRRRAQRAHGAALQLDQDQLRRGHPVARPAPPPNAMQAVNQTTSAATQTIAQARQHGPPKPSPRPRRDAEQTLGDAHRATPSARSAASPAKPRRTLEHRSFGALSRTCGSAAPRRSPARSSTRTRAVTEAARSRAWSTSPTTHHDQCRPPRHRRSATPSSAAERTLAQVTNAAERTHHQRVRRDRALARPGHRPLREPVDRPHRRDQRAHRLADQGGGRRARRPHDVARGDHQDQLDRSRAGRSAAPAPRPSGSSPASSARPNARSRPSATGITTRSSRTPPSSSGR